MNYLVIDLEMCRVKKLYRKTYKYASEIIQIGAVLLDEGFNRIVTMCEYVNPEYGVLDNFIESMTGIKNRDIKQAPKLTEALEHIKEKIDELQPHRNTVMHNKRMTQNEYEKVRKSLKNINKLLVEAINVLEKDIYTETKLVDVVSALGNMLVKVLGESISSWIEKMKPALSTLGELVIKSAVPKIDVSSVIPSLEIGNAMSAQMEQIRKQYQVVGNIAEQVNFAKRLENAGNQMAIAAAKQSATYNNSMLSQMGNLSQISKIDYTPAMDVARELSERNQRFANSLGINGMLGETVDTDKEDDDKEKDKNP